MSFKYSIYLIAVRETFQNFEKLHGLSRSLATQGIYLPIIAENWIFVVLQFFIFSPE